MHNPESSSPFPFDQLLYSMFSLPVSSEVASSLLRVQLVAGFSSAKTIVQQVVINGSVSEHYRIRAKAGNAYSDDLQLIQKTAEQEPVNQYRIQSKSVNRYSAWLYSNVIDQKDGDILFQLMIDYLSFQAREMSPDAFLDAILTGLMKMNFKDQSAQTYRIEEVTQWFTVLTGEQVNLQSIKSGKDQIRYTFRDLFESLVQHYLRDAIEKVIKREHLSFVLKNNEQTTIYDQSDYEFLMKSEMIHPDVDFSGSSWFISRFLDVLRYVVGDEYQEDFQIRHRESVFREFLYRISDLFRNTFRDEAIASLFFDLLHGYEPSYEDQLYSYLLTDLESAMWHQFVMDRFAIDLPEAIENELITFGYELYRRGYQTIYDRSVHLKIDQSLIEPFWLSVQSVLFYQMHQSKRYKDHLIFAQFEAYRTVKQQKKYKEHQRFDLWEQFLTELGSTINFHLHWITRLAHERTVMNSSGQLKAVDQWFFERNEQQRNLHREVIKLVDDLLFEIAFSARMRMIPFYTEEENHVILSLEKQKQLILYVNRMIETIDHEMIEDPMILHAYYEFLMQMNGHFESFLTQKHIPLQQQIAFWNLERQEELHTFIHRAMMFESAFVNPNEYVLMPFQHDSKQKDWYTNGLSNRPLWLLDQKATMFFDLASQEKTKLFLLTPKSKETFLINQEDQVFYRPLYLSYFSEESSVLSQNELFYAGLTIRRFATDVFQFMKTESQWIRMIDRFAHQYQERFLIDSNQQIDFSQQKAMFVESADAIVYWTMKMLLHHQKNKEHLMINAWDHYRFQRQWIRFVEHAFFYLNEQKQLVGTDQQKWIESMLGTINEMKVIDHHQPHWIELIMSQIEELYRLFAVLFRATEHSTVNRKEQIIKDFRFAINEKQIIQYTDEPAIEPIGYEWFNHTMDDSSIDCYEIGDYPYPLGLFQLGEHNLV